MSRCGIDIRGRAKKLYLNYRTTDEIRRQAVALLEGCEIDDLDDGHDETKRYKSLSHGPAPTVLNVEGIEAAAKHAIEFVRQWNTALDDGVPLSFCVIASSEKSRDAMAGSRMQLSEGSLDSLTAMASSLTAASRSVVSRWSATEAHAPIGASGHFRAAARRQVLMTSTAERAASIEDGTPAAVKSAAPDGGISGRLK